MNNQLTVLLKSSGLDAVKSSYMLEKFNAYFAIAEEWKIKAATIVTDKEGKARFFREKTGCEDVVQPFGQTITFVDRSWCEFSVRARGYRSLENASLAKFKYEDKGFFPEDRRQRVEFHIPLQPN